VKIVKIFRKNNKIKTVNIPTNGLAKEKILAKTLKISELDSKLTVYINFSLDGPKKIHDYLRGVPGGFEKTISTLQSVYKISEERANLFVTIETVVSAYNCQHLEELMAYIGRLKVPKILHYFEILRGIPKETGLAKKISPEDYQSVYQKILNYQTKRLAGFYKGERGAFLKMKLNLAHLRLFYKIQADSYFNINNWPMNCVAGRNILVIDYNGDIRVCELREKVTNAREKNFDLSDWKNVFKGERRKIKEGRCFCTHACFLYQSIHYSPKTIFLFLLPSFIKDLIKIR
jgi:MoaA/NifB/PqqE/SkfB family radical SAM enzyme